MDRENIDYRELEKYRFKSDIFCLGMVILELTTLKSSSDLYDFKTFRIKIRELEKRLVSIKQKYSRPLFEILFSMLKIEPLSRKSANELLQKIIKNSILKLL